MLISSLAEQVFALQQQVQKLQAAAEEQSRG